MFFILFGIELDAIALLYQAGLVTCQVKCPLFSRIDSKFAPKHLYLVFTMKIYNYDLFSKPSSNDQHIHVNF